MESREKMGVYSCDEDIIQNVKDVGFNEATITCFMDKFR